MAQIHPTAIVHPDAKLAEDVIIGPFCYVDGNVTIGSRTWLRAFVRIYDYTTIGEDCQLYENAIIGADPQDKGFKGEESFVVIGNRTVLRENVTIHRASGEGNCTSVGDDCLIMEGVHLGHNVTVENQVIISSKSGLAGYVSVGHNTVIGGLAGFHQFTRIGSYCMIGGASKNSQDVPPYTLVDGHPSRIYGLNVVGLRRNGFDAVTRDAIKSLYKFIYHSGLLLRDAVEQATADPRWKDNEAAQEVIAFFRGGDKRRGFCRWSNKKESRHD